MAMDEELHGEYDRPDEAAIDAPEVSREKLSKRAIAEIATGVIVLGAGAILYAGHESHESDVHHRELRQVQQNNQQVRSIIDDKIPGRDRYNPKPRQ